MRVRGYKKIFHANRNQKKAGVVIFMSDNKYFKIETVGTSLVVQWLRLCIFNAGGMDLISGQGTRPHITCGQKMKI